MLFIEGKSMFFFLNYSIVWNSWVLDVKSLRKVKLFHTSVNIPSSYIEPVIFTLVLGNVPSCLVCPTSIFVFRSWWKIHASVVLEGISIRKKVPSTVSYLPLLKGCSQILGTVFLRIAERFFLFLPTSRWRLALSLLLQQSLLPRYRLLFCYCFDILNSFICWQPLVACLGGLLVGFLFFHAVC